MGYVNIGGERVPIDKNLVPIIKTLNDKGYTTSGCCEGHWYPCFDRSDPYQYTPVYIGFKNALPPLGYIYNHLKDVGICRTYNTDRDFSKEGYDYLLVRPDINCIRFYLNNNPSDKWHKSRQKNKIIKLLQGWANEV